MTRFISELLDLSHTQWTFRNITLHSATNGVLANSRREQLAKEIYKLQHMDPKDIPEESQFLLEFDMEQEYWLAAIKTARLAGLQRIMGGRDKEAPQHENEHFTNHSQSNNFLANE